MKRHLAPFAAALLLSAPALGQQTHRVEVNPVDRGVGDLDLRGRSFRQIDPGLAALPTDGRIYDRYQEAGLSVDDPTAPPRLPGLAPNQRYRYIAPGVEATFNQPDYLIKTKEGNETIYKLNVAKGPRDRSRLIIPPGTIFHLIPPDQREQGPPLPGRYAIDPDDPRVDGRVDGRARNPVTGEPIVRLERVNARQNLTAADQAAPKPASLHPARTFNATPLPSPASLPPIANDIASTPAK